MKATMECRFHGHAGSEIEADYGGDIRPGVTTVWVKGRIKGDMAQELTLYPTPIQAEQIHRKLGEYLRSIGRLD